MSETNNTPQTTPAGAECCGACACVTCSCGCIAEQCRCQEANCQCGCSVPASTR